MTDKNHVPVFSGLFARLHIRCLCRKATPNFDQIESENHCQSGFILRQIFMTTVKKIIEQKAKTIFSVHSSDTVESVLKIMRDFRVRAVLVIDDGELMGIVSQGDCAIKVLLPHDNPTQVTVSKIMTRNPLTVKLSNSLEECMAIMVHKHIRHLPVLENNQVTGVVSIGDLVKNIIELQGNQIKFLETYIKGHGV